MDATATRHPTPAWPAAGPDALASRAIPFGTALTMPAGTAESTAISSPLVTLGSAVSHSVRRTTAARLLGLATASAPAAAPAALSAAAAAAAVVVPLHCCCGAAAVEPSAAAVVPLHHCWRAGAVEIGPRPTSSRHTAVPHEECRQYSRPDCVASSRQSQPPGTCSCVMPANTFSCKDVAHTCTTHK